MYLIDEYDLDVFHTDDERSFFKEVVSTYYSSNYRSSIVMLYSLLVLNLYNKLQIMANEDSKAEAKLSEINTKIKKNTKYSEIEIELVDYFTAGYSLFFTPIKKDMEYLKSLRDGCTHLSVDNERLFVPEEYQVRMMIISMYKNIFTQKPPFIQNLFNYLEDKLEEYGILYNLNETEYSRLKKKYFTRMNEESINKSISSFIKFAFFPPSGSIKKKNGAFYVLFYLTFYCEEIGLTSVWNSDSIKNRFKNPDPETIKDKENQRQLYDIILISKHFRDMMKEVNEQFFSLAIDDNLYSNTLEFIKNAKKIYPEENVFDLFTRKYNKFSFISFDTVYKELQKDDLTKVEINKFALETVKMVPDFNGFDTADSYFDFLINHFTELSAETINTAFEKMKDNNQVTNRRRFGKDINKIKELKDKRAEQISIPEEWETEEETDENKEE